MGLICGYTHFLPILVFILIALTFILTYSVAVGSNHVHPFWPYISDTGAFPPERSIFSLLIGISSALLSLTVYIRYRQVMEFVRLKPFVKISRLWNRVSIVFGYLSCLGLFLVANFEETYSFAVHIFAAILCFAAGIIYFAMQCIFTYRMKFASRRIFWLRILLAVLTTLFFILIFAPLPEALRRYKGNDVFFWKAKDGGYTHHIVSTVSEWLLVLSFLLYIFTFFFEFRRFEIMTFELKFHEIDVKENSDKSDKNILEHSAMSQWV